MNPEAEMVKRLDNAEHLYDEEVQQMELHHLHTDAAALIESQSSRIAELERQLLQADTDYELERVAYRALERDLAAAREALEKYAQHLPTCLATDDPANPAYEVVPCVCGLDAARNAGKGE